MKMGKLRRLTMRCLQLVVVLFILISVLAGISAPSVTAQPDRKEIMLSFDDGPIPGANGYILDQLDLMESLPGVEGARAAFFMVGIDKSLSFGDDWQFPNGGVQQNPDIVQEVANRGHFVFSHTLHHPTLTEMEENPSMVDEEVIGAYDIIVAAGVSTLKIFRAPRHAYPRVSPDSRLAEEGWKQVRYTTTGDPSIPGESGVIAITKWLLERETEWPAVLTFHEFRGQDNWCGGVFYPQLNYVNIIQELVDSGYTVVDFDPARAQADLNVVYPNTPIGPLVSVDLGNVQVTFDSVTAEGRTSVTTSQDNPEGSLPSGFRVQGPFIDISTLWLTYTGPVTVDIGYDDSGIGNENNLKLFHWDGSRWSDVTTSVNPANNIVSGQVATLSWFFVGDTAPSEEGEGCFIATAAYGSYLDSHVETLRNLRDSYMVTNPVGSALVSLYYKVSPPVAGFIDDHPTLKPIVRAGLLPAVAMSTVAVNTTPAQKVAIVASLALVSVAIAVWLNKRRGKGVIPYL